MGIKGREIILSLDPADGRYVVFFSDAGNLVTGDTNGFRDIFLKTPESGVLTRISTDAFGNQGNGNSYNPSISADGRYTVFQKLCRQFGER